MFLVEKCKLDFKLATLIDTGAAVRADAAKNIKDVTSKALAASHDVYDNARKADAVADALFGDKMTSSPRPSAMPSPPESSKKKASKSIKRSADTAADGEESDGKRARAESV